MKQVIGVILGIVSLCIFSLEAQACSCGSRAFEHRFRAASYVFAGTVEQIEIDSLDVSTFKVTVAVDKYWKGDVTKTFHVWTKRAGVSCGYPFEIGTRYLIYARDPVAEYINQIYTHLCTRNNKYEDAGIDLEMLGQGAIPVSNEKELIENGEITLDQAYPNPASTYATISFSLVDAKDVELTIHDLLGRKLEGLALGFHPAGRHIIRWNTTGYASGPYLYRLRQGNRVITKQIIITK